MSKSAHNIADLFNTDKCIDMAILNARDIIDTAERLYAGNVTHHKSSIKTNAKHIVELLEKVRNERKATDRIE